MVRTLAEKTGARSDMKAYFLNVPEDILDEFAAQEIDIARTLRGEFGHIHMFVSTVSDLDRHFATLKGHVAARGRLWVSWPKGGRNGTDLSIREVIRIGYAHGMVESTALSVNDVWSAIKFTHPIPNKVYNNSYGKLPMRQP